MNTKFIIFKKNNLFPHVITLDDVPISKELNIHYSNYYDLIFCTSISNDECNDDDNDVSYSF